MEKQNEVLDHPETQKVFNGKSEKEHLVIMSENVQSVVAALSSTTNVKEALSDSNSILKNYATPVSRHSASNRKEQMSILDNENRAAKVGSPNMHSIQEAAAFSKSVGNPRKTGLSSKRKTSGDRELKSPISFSENSQLLNYSSTSPLTGRQSVPLFNHKGYLLTGEHTSGNSLQPRAGNYEKDPLSPSNVLKRIAGRQAINSFYNQKYERPHSAVSKSFDDPNTKNVDQFHYQRLESYCSDSTLHLLKDSTSINDATKKAEVAGKYNNKKDILDKQPDNVTDRQFEHNLDETHDQNNSGETSYTQQLQEGIRGESVTHVYAKRWYLLALFSLTSMLWSAVWSTWGPIAQSAKSAYGWDDGIIAMFTWLGNIPFLITMFPIAYLMDVKGMRIAMILCCGLIFLGSGLRCIPCDDETAKWLISAGQLLNGIAGTVPMSGSALLSGLWFPSNQRASATALSTIAGYFGASVSYVIGPLIVPEVDDSSGNVTVDLSSCNGSNPDCSEQRAGIMYLLYGECCAAALMFFLVVIYFPSKPALPPSISASIPREKYLSGLKKLVRNKQFWLTAIAFSFPAGVYEVWQVVLDVNLDHLNVSQSTAGWMDFYATVGGCISGMLVSRFADYFIRQMKVFLLVFYLFATIAFLWCTFIVTDILPFDTVSLYAAIVLGGIFLDGGGPLFFELVCEVSYPVGEGVTSGCLQLMCSAAGIVFLIVVQVNTTGKQWMNWFFLATITLAIPLLFFIKVTYGRADVDDLEVSAEEDNHLIKA